MSDQIDNRWFFENNYSLSFWPRIRAWLVSNDDDSYILMFKTLHAAQDWADSEGALMDGVVVIRDERKPL